MILIKHINSCLSKIFIFCTLQITCINQLGKILWKDSNLVFYKRNKTIWDFQVYIRSNDSINNRISHRETIIWMSKPDKNKSTNYLYRYTHLLLVIVNIYNMLGNLMHFSLIFMYQPIWLQSLKLLSFIPINLKQI